MKLYSYKNENRRTYTLYYTNNERIEMTEEITKNQHEALIDFLDSENEFNN